MRFVRQGGVVLVGEAVSRLIGFAGLPLAALFLSNSELGSLAIAMLALSLMVILFDFGVPGAATKLHFDDEDGDGHRGLWWLMLSIIGGGFIVVLLAGPLVVGAAFQDVSFYPLIFAVVITAVGGALTAFGQARYRATFQFERFAGLAVARSVLLVGPGVVGAALTNTAIGYVYGIAIGQVLLGVITVGLFRHEIGTPTSASWRPALLFGLPLVPHLLFGWWLSLADRVLLERWWGLAEVGIYALAYQLSFATGLLLMGLNNLWAPVVYRLFSRDGSERGDAAVAVAVIPALSGFVLAGALTATIAPWVYELIRPESPAPDGIFAVVVLASLFFGIYLLGVSPVFARSASKVVPIVTGIGVVANLGGNLMLIPDHGGTGAAFATLLGYAATAIALILAGRAIGFSSLLLARLSAAFVALVVLGIALVLVPAGMELAVFWVCGLLLTAAAIRVYALDRDSDRSGV